MPLGFDALSLCILYAALWTNTVQDAELVKRSKISIAALIIGVTMLFFKWNAFFPHPVR